MNPLERLNKEIKRRYAALHFKVPAVTPTVRSGKRPTSRTDVKNRLALMVQRAERYRDDPAAKGGARAAR